MEKKAKNKHAYRDQKGKWAANVKDSLTKSQRPAMSAARERSNALVRFRVLAVWFMGQNVGTTRMAQCAAEQQSDLSTKTAEKT